MDFIWELFHRIYDVESLVRVGGIIGLTTIVFVETGLLIGFFLPGDSLLVTAGLFAARGDLELLTLILCLSAAAILGDTLGYNIGARAGPRLFSRPDSLLFNKKRFVAYNVVGGIGWVLSMILGGYFLGQLIPNIHKNIDKVIVVVIFLSLLPIIVKYLRERGKQYS